jgi:plastocyanin
MVRRRWTVMALLLVLGLVGAACGGDDGDATTPAATGEPTGDATGEPTDGGNGGGGSELQIQDFNFNPAEISVASGDTVSVLNVDATAHTFTSSDAGFDETFEGGASGDVTIEAEPGEYQFVCRFHSGMQGTLTVT